MFKEFCIWRRQICVSLQNARFLPVFTNLAGEWLQIQMRNRREVLKQRRTPYV